MSRVTARGRLRVLLVAGIVAILAFAVAPHVRIDSTAALTPNAAATGPAGWKCSSADLGLDEDRVELAPVNPAEKTPTGGKIVPSPDPRGRWVPVIFVHGWTSRSTHPTADGTARTAGSFSHLVDLTANRLVPLKVPRSLIGQVQGIEGAAPFTFDYHPYSGRWVDDPHLGPALGKVIDCLSRASGERVIIVGHSMGGLIARYAAAGSDGGGTRAAKVSRVITLGTPNQGSLAATVVAGIIDGAAVTNEKAALVRLLLSACGAASTATMDTGTICDIAPPVAAFYGDAGVALRYGSSQIKALKPVPAGITVNALAGGTKWTVPKVGWFTFPWATTNIDLGDIIVTPGSALAAGTSKDSVSCSYQMNAVRGVSDWIGLQLQLTAKADVAASPLGTASGPCFHTSLMRSMELTNDVMGYISDDLEARNPRVSITAATIGTMPAGFSLPAGLSRTSELGALAMCWNGPTRYAALAYRQASRFGETVSETVESGDMAAGIVMRYDKAASDLMSQVRAAASRCERRPWSRYGAVDHTQVFVPRGGWDEAVGTRTQRTDRDDPSMTYGLTAMVARRGRSIAAAATWTMYATPISDPSTDGSSDLRTSMERMLTSMPR